MTLNDGQTGPLTIVLKLGSSSIVHAEPPHLPQIAVLSAIVETCVSLRALGHHVVIVSSGAIAMGRHRMEMHGSPAAPAPAAPPAAAKKGSTTANMGEKQALAAIGQGRLIALWDQLFGTVKQPIAQILMTRNDIADHSRYLNATTTFSTLLSMGVIPIVNENDTVSVSEILHINKFGDNDTLSAIAAGMCRADYLFLLTDVEGLYEDNPRKVLGAKRVSVVHDIEEVRKLVSTSTLGTSLGTGGMETKLIAAELATATGCSTVITLGSDPSRILPIVTANPSARYVDSAVATGVEFAAPDASSSSSSSSTVLPPHTLFTPKARPLSSRRFWILHGLTPRGTVYVDEGAYHAITNHHSHRPSQPHHDMNERSGRGNGGRLLPAGVVHVEGTFAAGQAVKVCVIVGRQSLSRRTRERQRSRKGAESRPESGDESDWSVHRRRRSHMASDGERGDESHDEQVATDADRKISSSTSSLSKSALLQAEPNHGPPALRANESIIEFGRGLTNYNSAEIDRVKGLPSRDIERVLGYVEAEHVVESVVELRVPAALVQS